jgi:hypothetical protein
MADVFLSYKRDERAAVETIAALLRDLGLTVWFDASMSAGETFNAEIDREARAAKAILVCWSPAARKSEWVNAEAMIGFEQKKLAACYVAGPDRFSAPTPFNTTHAEDLRAWLTAPGVTHSGWKSVLRRLGKLCGRGDIESYGAIDAHASTSDLRTWIERYSDSPLFISVDRLLKAGEAEEAERARIEVEARARRHREAVERRAQEAAARLAHDQRARLKYAEKEARRADARQGLIILVLVVGFFVAFFSGVISYNNRHGAPSDPARAWVERRNEDALQRLPRTARDFRQLGDAYLFRGDYERALVSYNAAIRIDPRDADAYQGRANVYRLSGNSARASADDRQAAMLRGERR